MQHYIPEDVDFMLEQQQKLINQKCFQISSLGFNSGRYDVNLIKKYFMTLLGQSGERGMKTFADRLKYHNNLDVEPFLGALESMQGFYTRLGIEIFKDAVLYRGFNEKCAAGHTEPQRRPGVVCLRQGGLQNAQRSGRRGTEPGLLSKA